MKTTSKKCNLKRTWPQSKKGGLPERRTDSMEDELTSSLQSRIKTNSQEYNITGRWPNMKTTSQEGYHWNMTSTKTIIRILQLQRRQSNWKQLQLAKLELSLAQLSPSLFPYYSSIIAIWEHYLFYNDITFNDILQIYNIKL